MKKAHEMRSKVIEKKKRRRQHKRLKREELERKDGLQLQEQRQQRKTMEQERM